MALSVWNGTSWVSALGVKVWNGASWVSATAGKIWNGSAWVDFLASITFTPAGGTSGSPTLLSDNGYDVRAASVTISASSSVTWYWTKLSGSGTTTVSVASGSSATSITVTAGLSLSPRYGTYSIYASDGITNKYWEVFVNTDGTGAVMTL